MCVCSNPLPPPTHTQRTSFLTTCLCSKIHLLGVVESEQWRRKKKYFCDLVFAIEASKLIRRIHFTVYACTYSKMRVSAQTTAAPWHFRCKAMAPQQIFGPRMSNAFVVTFSATASRLLYFFFLTDAFENIRLHKTKSRLDFARIQVVSLGERSCVFQWVITAETVDSRGSRPLADPTASGTRMKLWWLVTTQWRLGRPKFFVVCKEISEEFVSNQANLGCCALRPQVVLQNCAMNRLGS